MSATGHDALNGARGTLHSLDVPEVAETDPPDFTEDLADEVTSELGTSARAPLGHVGHIVLQPPSVYSLKGSESVRGTPPFAPYP